MSTASSRARLLANGNVAAAIAAAAESAPPISSEQADLIRRAFAGEPEARRSA